METTLAAPLAPPANSRALLHQLIDQIEDEAVLQAALLLLRPQVAQVEAEEPPLTPEQIREFDKRLGADYDPAKNIPFAEVMQRLQQSA